ncbi:MULTISPECIES: hypothetical protein [Listeria]|uniref:hypothetical protein n=1 Tax=Listeria TaxID=1637 RepID=UPI001F086DF9|nr:MULTISPECIES: hypothetical protein [Listeria]
MMAYKSMIAKALTHNLIEQTSVPVYGSFPFSVAGELVQLDGLWIANLAGVTFFSETEAYFVNKMFSYHDIAHCSRHISLLAMSPKIKFTLLDGTTYTMLVEQEDAKRFVQTVRERQHHA